MPQTREQIMADHDYWQELADAIPGWSLHGWSWRNECVYRTPTRWGPSQNPDLITVTWKQRDELLAVIRDARANAPETSLRTTPEDASRDVRSASIGARRDASHRDVPIHVSTRDGDLRNDPRPSDVVDLLASWFETHGTCFSYDSSEKQRALPRELAVDLTAMVRPVLRRLLRVIDHVEWVQPMSNSGPSCPWCGNMKHWGHEPTCEITLLLQELRDEEDANERGELTPAQAEDNARFVKRARDKREVKHG